MWRHDQAGYPIEHGNGHTAAGQDPRGIAHLPRQTVVDGTLLKRFLLLYLLGVFALIVGEKPALETRAIQVSLASYTYVDGVLAGSIDVQNIAFTKVVTVVYAVGDSWSDGYAIPASYSASGTGGYETWVFAGPAAGATQFYIRYEVDGSSYYDPGNSVNHKLPGSAPPSTSSTAAATPLPPAGTGAVTASQPPAILPTSIPYEPVPPEPPAGCGNFNGGDSCPASDIYTFPSSSENRRWQTPPRAHASYVSTFQDMRDLVGYADIQYNPARTDAVVVVNAASRTGESLGYSFGGGSQTSSSSSNNTFQVPSSFAGSLAITITSASGKTLVLDPLNFIWQNSPLVGAQSGFDDGQKGGIVELFGWPYNDVALECTFLGRAGYMGVKIWPATEHVWGSNYYEKDKQFRPWYLVYQPVSYRLHSRMGTRTELRAMIQTCRSAGVRVYADAVVNHMVGQGNDIQNHRYVDRNGDCIRYSGHNATAGSPYFTSGNTFRLNPFTGTRPTLEFPAVPYGPTDFHCERSLSSWTDGQIITKGWLVGLADLNSEKPYVQDRIASYLVDLMSIGFSGFRIDAAKHTGPASLAAILRRVRTKLGGSMPADWITWLEVIMGGESGLLACGGGQWSWYTNLDRQLSANGFSAADIAKVKIWSSDYPKEMPICGEWIIPASRFAIQNDDHDQQNPGSSSRDMQDKGSVLIKDKDASRHRSFEVQLFARTDASWNIKLVLSSYMFTSRGGSGFPDGLSDCSLYTGSQAAEECLGVPRDTAHVGAACAYQLAPGRYTRVHRDVAIVNAMRAWVGLQATTAAGLGIPGCI